MPSLATLWGGVRSLSRSRVVSVAAVTALALGLGGAITIFSVIDAVLLNGVPFRDPERLVAIWEKNPALNLADMYAAPLNYLEWRRCSSLESAGAIQNTRLNLVAGPNGHIE